MSKSDFFMGKLESKLVKWRNELANGRGFVVIRGAPVDRWSIDDQKLFFFGLGLRLGMPGAQDEHGSLLASVRNEKKTETVRAYRTNGPIAYHCDAADIVGLLCLKNSARGGQSRIASSVSVFNELPKKAPQYAPRLFEPYYLDAHDAKYFRYFPIAPCRYSRGTLRTFYHADYFRSVTRHGLKLSAFDRDVLDAYEAIANEDAFHIDMDLAPGDIQLLSNHTQIHARTAYEDDDGSERHLLRLWLSNRAERRELWRRTKARASLIGTMAAQVARQMPTGARA